MKRTIGECLVEFPVGRDQSSLNDFCESEDGAALRASQFFSSIFFCNDIAEFHGHEGGNMEAFAEASYPECGFRMDLRNEPFDCDTDIHNIAAHRSRSSRIRSALLLNVRADFVSLLRNLSIRFQAAS